MSSDRSLKGNKFVIVSSTEPKWIQSILTPLGCECVTISPEQTNGITESFNGVVIDATSVSHPQHLSSVFAATRPLLNRISSGGKLLFVGPAPRAGEAPLLTSASQGLELFSRSLGKELGGRGIVSNVLGVPVPLASEKSSRDSLLSPLAFFLSEQSAYVSGQYLELDADAGCALPPVPSSPCTFFITGCGRGIGAAIVQNVAMRGRCRLVLLDHPAMATDLEALARTLRDQNELATNVFSVHTMLHDLALPDAHADVVKDLEDVAKGIPSFEGVNSFIHNAGITLDRTAARMDRDRFHKVMQVNTLFPVAFTETVLPTGPQPAPATSHALVANHARMVFLSSISGIAGQFGQTNYAASKGSLIGYARGKSRERRVRERGITLNAVAPGFIETQMTQKIPFMQRQLGRRLNALGQGGLPHDVAEAVGFLGGAGAGRVTGQVLRVCGLHITGA